MRKVVWINVLIVTLAISFYCLGYADAKRFKSQKQAPAECSQYLDRLSEIDQEMQKLKLERMEVQKKYQECYKARDKGKDVEKDKDTDDVEKSEKPEKEKKVKKK